MRSAAEHLKHIGVVRSLLMGLALTATLGACRGGGSAASNGASTEPQPRETVTNAEAPQLECYVDLYEGGDIDANGITYRLTQVGRYGDMTALPGADHNWDGAAGSLAVGVGARATVWSEPQFGGTSEDLGPGDHRNLTAKPRSIALTCG